MAKIWEILLAKKRNQDKEPVVEPEKEEVVIDNPVPSKTLPTKSLTPIGHFSFIGKNFQINKDASEFVSPQTRVSIGIDEEDGRMILKPTTNDNDFKFSRYNNGGGGILSLPKNIYEELHSLGYEGKYLLHWNKEKGWLETKPEYH